MSLGWTKHSLLIPVPVLTVGVESRQLIRLLIGFIYKKKLVEIRAGGDAHSNWQIAAYILSEAMKETMTSYTKLYHLLR